MTFSPIVSAARGIIKLFQYSPRSLAMASAMQMADAYRLFDRRHRRIALINLEIAFPRWTDKQRVAVMRESYRGLARLAVEVARLPLLHSGNIGNLVQYDDNLGLKHYQQAAAQGKGVLFLTGHFSSFELLPYAHALYGYPLHFLVRPLNHPGLEALISKYRTACGNRIIPKRGAIKPILQTLQQGKDVGILIDQNVQPQEGIFVPFFGKPACTTSGLALVALKTGAPVIPGRIQWLPEKKRYLIKFYPPVPLATEGDKDFLVRENTIRFNRIVEAWICEDPTAWLWGHMRWHTRPPDDPESPYRRR